MVLHRPVELARLLGQVIAGLRIEHLEQREEQWAIVDLKEKAGPVRTVPVPGCVKEGCESG